MNSRMELLQARIGAWSEKNFPHDSSAEKVLGIVEEMGELTESFMRLNHLVMAGARLSHLSLKKKQGIRYTEDELRLLIFDAVGDIMIYLADFCSKEGISMEAAFERTAKEVLERDWAANPLEADKMKDLGGCGKEKEDDC